MLITSDQHFYHRNIIKPEYEDRPFIDLDNMHECMIMDWNSVVHKKDFVYVLGDLAFGNKEMIRSILDRLNGRIHLIMGNHDGKRSYKWWMECGIEWASKYPVVYEDNYILSHRPVKCLPEGYYNVHGHTHSKVMGLGYFNVSVDNIGYKPIDFRKVKEKLANGQTR